MKKFLLTIILISFICPYAGGQTEYETKKQIIKYQVNISTKTADHIQDIYDKFNESFIDHEPALNSVNILINEYNNAMQLIPGSIPQEGEKLHELMRSLLSRVELYFIYYKNVGREHGEINMRIFRALYEVTREADKLTYQYL